MFTFNNCEGQVRELLDEKVKPWKDIKNERDIVPGLHFTDRSD